ncbi:MAG: ABC transporter ATP-binding protein [Planctomycetia bacterium]|nr:MAG: ABC transporter ATP-binding protein [Planctomycetia bacterium]
MNVIEVSELRKSYRAPDGTPAPVLNVPRFNLAHGEQLALHGGSGSGKTTFLNVLAGILLPDSGSVRICGRDISTLRESARDRLRAIHVGYVFQTFNLLQGFTALENVLLAMSFGRGASRPRARELLARVGLADRADYRPRQLSVGQQQRVAIARAVANRPSVILADEPTGNLDRANAAAALALIRELCGECGAALLLVSHDSDVLAAFDRTLRMDELNRMEPVVAGAGR